jgi:hypothetical protein
VKKIEPADKCGMLARFLLCSLFCACASAQATGTPPAEVSPFQFTGAVDAFYSLNLNQPASDVNQLRNFDTKDGFLLDFASFSIQANGPKFGFHLDTGFGEMYRTMNLADSWAGPNRYISQAYVSYRPIWNSKLQLDAGKFFTSVGAEAPESYNNFNYSRSLLYVLGEPYYHFGVRSTIPVGKGFSTGAQFLAGCNNLGNLSGGKMFAVVASLARTKWSWNHTYLGGVEKLGGNDGFRHLHDSVLTVAPRTWLNAYFEVLFASEHWQRRPSDSWHGLAGAARFSPLKKWSFSPRLDWFSDSTGFNTGRAQQLKEITLTAEYRPATFLIARAEYRRDWSDQPFFDRGATARSSKQQGTFLVAWILVVKRER